MINILNKTINLINKKIDVRFSSSFSKQLMFFYPGVIYISMLDMEKIDENTANENKGYVRIQGVNYYISTDKKVTLAEEEKKDLQRTVQKTLEKLKLRKKMPENLEETMHKVEIKLHEILLQERSLLENQNGILSPEQEEKISSQKKKLIDLRDKILEINNEQEEKIKIFIKNFTTENIIEKIEKELAARVL